MIAQLSSVLLKIIVIFKKIDWLRIASNILYIESIYKNSQYRHLSVLTESIFIVDEN